MAYQHPVKQHYRYILSVRSRCNGELPLSFRPWLRATIIVGL
jgi:hypothetical protein